MKTINLFSLLAVNALLTMSLGFPTKLAQVKSNSHKEATVMALSEVKPNKTVLVEALEEEPVLQPIAFSTSSDKITVKVFDVKGAVVLTKQVAMSEFLAQNKQIELAGKSTFVMFHANTAYYFLEADTNQ